MKTEQNPFDEYWHRIFVASHNLWLTTHSRIHSSFNPCARFNFNKSDKLSVSHQVSWHDVFTNMHLLIEFKCQHKFPLSFSQATFQRWRKKLYVSTNNIWEDLFNMQQNMCCYLNNFTAFVCHVYTAHIIYIYCLNGSHFLFEHKLNTEDILACLTTTITNWWASLALDDLS